MKVGFQKLQFIIACNVLPNTWPFPTDQGHVQVFLISFSTKNNFLIAVFPPQETGILLYKATCDLPNLTLSSQPQIKQCIMQDYLQLYFLNGLFCLGIVKLFICHFTHVIQHAWTLFTLAYTCKWIHVSYRPALVSGREKFLYCIQKFLWAPGIMKCPHFVITERTIKGQGHYLFIVGRGVSPAVTSQLNDF